MDDLLMTLFDSDDEYAQLIASVNSLDLDGMGLTDLDMIKKGLQLILLSTQPDTYCHLEDNLSINTITLKVYSNDTQQI